MSVAGMAVCRSWWSRFAGHVQHSYVFCVQVEECVVCSDKPAAVLFKPCDHMCACEGIEWYIGLAVLPVFLIVFFTALCIKRVVCYRCVYPHCVCQCLWDLFLTVVRRTNVHPTLMLILLMHLIGIFPARSNWHRFFLNPVHVVFYLHFLLWCSTSYFSDLLKTSPYSTPSTLFAIADWSIVSFNSNMCIKSLTVFLFFAAFHTLLWQCISLYLSKFPLCFMLDTIFSCHHGCWLSIALQSTLRNTFPCTTSPHSFDLIHPNLILVVTVAPLPLLIPTLSPNICTSPYCLHLVTGTY